MDKTDSKPVSDKELEEESEIEEVIEKDGAGYGDLQSLNAQPDDTNRDAETYVGRPAPVKSETYIQERKSYSMGMTDQNKLKNTKLGDHINYYDNGVSGNGIVSKMSGQFIQIFKDDGKFYNININDTFHVSDILINKTWDDMDLAERTDELMKIKAYSPRFLNKSWDQLPRELKDVMKKDGALPKNPKNYTADEELMAIATSEQENANQAQAHINDNNWANLQDRLTSHDYTHTGKKIKPVIIDDGGDKYVAPPDRMSRQPKGKRKSNISKAEWDSMKSSSEDGAFGNTGSSPTTGVSTKIPFDATEDYEGTTHDTRPKQFEYEDEKPEVGNEPKAPEVKLDEQGLIKANPSFVYSDNPQGYKLPPQPKQKGYGMRYGVKYINEEESN